MPYTVPLIVGDLSSVLPIMSVLRHVCIVAKSYYYLLHVCPSVHMDQHSSRWMDLCEI
jgi:hypothetical protein